MDVIDTSVEGKNVERAPFYLPCKLQKVAKFTEEEKNLASVSILKKFLCNSAPAVDHVTLQNNRLARCQKERSDATWTNEEV